MRFPRALPLPAILICLFVATALSLVAVSVLPPGPRGAAIAALSLTKAMLVVLGFMQLQRESKALAGALVGYAALICLLAGARIALSGIS